MGYYLEERQMIKNTLTIILVLLSYYSILFSTLWIASIFMLLAFLVLFLRPIIKELQDRGADLSILDRVLDKDKDLFK